MAFLYPGIKKFFNFKTVDQDVEDFIVNQVKTNLKYREENNVTRKDFFQLLIQLRNTGTVRLDGDWDTTYSNKDEKQLTVDEVAAQVFVFVMAGFETTSSAMGFCLYELAKKPECQRKLQKEIDDVLAKHNGEITFEAIQDMTYLDNCFDGKTKQFIFCSSFLQIVFFFLQK